MLYLRPAQSISTLSNFVRFVYSGWMETTATEAKQNFGELFMAAVKETVWITKNGKIRLAVVSAERMEGLLRLEDEVGLMDPDWVVATRSVGQPGNASDSPFRPPRWQLPPEHTEE